MSDPVARRTLIQDLQDFYRQLANGDRQFVILPDVAHSVTWSRNRHLFWHAMQAFLTMPQGVGS